MAGQVTTLYLDETSVRLMVSRGKRVHKAAEARLDVKMAGTSTKVMEAEIAATIKQLFKANKVGTTKVIVGMSGLHCLSRPAVLPQLPRAMLDEAMAREAKRVLPVPPEQLYISWQIIGASEGKMQAFMVAMPRTDADFLVGILHQVGLKPYLMDIKPMALARLVPEPTAIMLDIQARDFDIVIIDGGIPQPVRTLVFPEAVASLKDRLPAVRDELRRTVQFYNANNPAKPIQQDVTLYVSGEIGADAELSDTLSRELGYRVMPLPSLLKFPKQLDPSRYMVNVGLAFKEAPREAGLLLPNLNTLPVPYQPRQISLGKLMVVPAAVVAVGVIAMVAMTVQNAAANIYDVQTRLDTTNSILEQRQAQKKSIAEKIATLEKELASAESARKSFVEALDSINADGERIDGDLTAAVNNLVSNLALRSIGHSGKGLSISGTALSEAEVLAYARNLKATSRFARITISSIARVGEEATGGEEGGSSVTFSLTLTLQEME